MVNFLQLFHFLRLIFTDDRYEFVYLWNFNPNSVTKMQFVCQVFLAIITPSASIGYLIIFLKLQPNAYHEFLCMLYIRSNIIPISESKSRSNASSFRLQDSTINIDNSSFSNKQQSIRYYNDIFNEFTDEELIKLIDNHKNNSNNQNNNRNSDNSMNYGLSFVEKDRISNIIISPIQNQIQNESENNNNE